MLNLKIRKLLIVLELGRSREGPELAMTLSPKECLLAWGNYYRNAVAAPGKLQHSTSHLSWILVALRGGSKRGQWDRKP